MGGSGLVEATGGWAGGDDTTAAGGNEFAQGNDSGGSGW
jgi:hypothetical protein